MGYSRHSGHSLGIFAIIVFQCPRQGCKSRYRHQKGVLSTPMYNHTCVRNLEVQVSNGSLYISHLVSNAATVRTGGLMLCIGLCICSISTCLVEGKIILCLLATADLSGRTRFEETLYFAALELASAPCSSSQLHPRHERKFRTSHTSRQKPYRRTSESRPRLTTDECPKATPIGMPGHMPTCRTPY